MAINLLGASNAQVHFGDPSFIDGLTEITVAITVLASSIANNERIVSKWGNASGEPAFLITVVSTDEILWVVNNGTGAALRGRTTTDSPAVTGTLLRIICRWRASDQLTPIWVNGAARSLTDTFTNNVAALGTTIENVEVGFQSDESVDGIDADYSEFALWGRYLSDDECYQYGIGVSPRYMRSGGGIYCPMYNINNLADEFRSQTGTNVSGTSAPHPRMFNPA